MQTTNFQKKAFTKLFLVLVIIFTLGHASFARASEADGLGVTAVRRVQLGVLESKNATILVYGDEHTSEHVQFVYCPVSNLDDPKKTEDVSLANEACSQIGPRTYSQAEIMRMTNSAERRISITSYGAAPLVVFALVMMSPTALIGAPAAGLFVDFVLSTGSKQLGFVLESGLPGSKRRPKIFVSEDLEMIRDALIVALKELEMDEQPMDSELGNPAG